MTQKIYRTLQNITQRSCCIWGALIAALLVHVLLALLFKHTPGENRQDVSELPRVGHIVLSSKNNAELAQWMKNHDPAVMTAADPLLGYSQIINQKHLRSEPEDLPNLMQPVMQQKITGINQVSTFKIPRKGVLPGNIHMIPAEKNRYAGMEEAAAVVFNGEYSSDLGKLFSALLAEIRQQLPADMEKLPDTQLEIVPGRFAETGSRVVVAQSCGNAVLDRKALETLHKYMFVKSGSTVSGEAVFRWRNIKNMEQKL